MATKIYDHITIDGDDAKLDGSLIANLENNAEFDALKEDLNLLNSYDLLKGNHRNTDYSANGTTWHWNGESCTVSGTATASTVYDLYRNENAFPSWLSAGQTVYIKYSAQVVRFTIHKYVNGTFNTTPIIDTTSYDGLLTIPADATGITIRFRMVKNTTANESVSVIFANYESNEKLQSKSIAIENMIIGENNAYAVEIGHGYFEGKIVNPNNVAVNAENWANTGIVPLNDTYDYIKLLNVSAGQSCFALFLDNNQNVISSDLSDSNGVLAAERIIKPPVGATYIRCNMLKANKDIFKIYGLKTNLVVRNAVPESANQTFHAMTGNKLHTIFRKTKAIGSLFTITDDDTTSLSNVQKFHTVCMAEGIRGCYAVMTKNTEADSNIVDALREYEKDGFQCVVHCHHQRPIYKPAPDRDIAACREDMAIALQNMQKYGFSDYRHWISPYGVRDQEMKDFARDFGFDCLITVPTDTYCRFIPQNAYGLYSIPRMELYPTDDVAINGNTMAEIKAQMLDCATNGGWFHLCTHMYQWGGDLSRVTEILQYANSLGMKNVTISGGLSYWRDIYRLYDLF